MILFYFIYLGDFQTQIEAELPRGQQCHMGKLPKVETHGSHVATHVAFTWPCTWPCTLQTMCLSQTIIHLYIETRVQPMALPLEVF
jgi:hypothetical protein